MPSVRLGMASRKWSRRQSPLRAVLVTVFSGIRFSLRVARQGRKLQVMATLFYPELSSFSRNCHVRMISSLSVVALSSSGTGANGAAIRTILIAASSRTA